MALTAARFSAMDNHRAEVLLCVEQDGYIGRNE